MGVSASSDQEPGDGVGKAPGDAAGTPGGISDVLAATQDQCDVLKSLVQTQDNLANTLERGINSKFAVFEKLIKQHLDSLTTLVQVPSENLAINQEDMKAALASHLDATNGVLREFKGDFEKLKSTVADDLKRIHDHLNANIMAIEQLAGRRDLAITAIHNDDAEIVRTLNTCLNSAEQFANDQDAKQKFVRFQTDEIARHVKQLKSETEAMPATFSKSMNDNWKLRIASTLKVAKEDAEKAAHHITSVVAKVSNADEALNDAGRRFADHLLSLLARPEHIARIVREAATCTFHEADGLRPNVVEKLPELVDVLENELRSWKATLEPQVSPQRVVTMLENVLRTTYNWLSLRGIDRFGQPGDKYNYAIHVQSSAADAIQESDYDTVKEVVNSGYRLRDPSQTLLRRARVVVWERPRNAPIPPVINPTP